MKRIINRRNPLKIFWQFDIDTAITINDRSYRKIEICCSAKHSKTTNVKGEANAELFLIVWLAIYEENYKICHIIFV